MCSKRFVALQDRIQGSGGEYIHRRIQRSEISLYHGRFCHSAGFRSFSRAHGGHGRAIAGQRRDGGGRMIHGNTQRVGRGFNPQVRRGGQGQQRFAQPQVRRGGGVVRQSKGGGGGDSKKRK